MLLIRKIKEKGVSLRSLSVFMVVISLIIAGMLLVASIRTFSTFRQLKETTNDYLILQDSATELMSASDYLTEEVQCYTVIGERKHLDHYFTEAEETRRREHALSGMQEKAPGSPALAELEAGMRESLSLMEREYYAMKLMLEAQEDPDVPEVLQTVALSGEDQALDRAGKTELARRMVHDSAYYEQKDRIRSNMARCVTNLKDEVHHQQQDLEAKTRREMIAVGFLIILQSLVALAILAVTNRLGVNPVVRAVDHIRKDQTMPIIGAAEFRSLAGSYNKMYNAYKKSIENLNFKASHDELTGVYNRAGYDLIKSSLDLNSTALLLFDADQFKLINDHYGHETGDRMLKKIAETLRKYFRSDDYICRIGGDEFVVFMVHLSAMPTDLIENKIVQINRELKNPADGMPPVTLSAGISLGNEESDPMTMFREADISLYYVKDHGRNGCCFFKEELRERAAREAVRLPSDTFGAEQ